MVPKHINQIIKKGGKQKGVLMGRVANTASEEKNRLEKLEKKKIELMRSMGLLPFVDFKVDADIASLSGFAAKFIAGECEAFIEILLKEENNFGYKPAAYRIRIMGVDSLEREPPSLRD